MRDAQPGARRKCSKSGRSLLLQIVSQRATFTKFYFLFRLDWTTDDDDDDDQVVKLMTTFSLDSSFHPKTSSCWLA